MKNELTYSEFAGEPTYYFSVNEKVKVGNLENATVIEVLDGGKGYNIQFKDYKDRQKTQSFLNERIFSWVQVRPITNTRFSLIKNNDIFIRYMNQDISSLVGTFCSSGIDMTPSYQRDYVWGEKDRINLLDSIFNNISIGTFVLARRSYGTKNELYEVIDGKQRISAIVDFYLNKFEYAGLSYNNLSYVDQQWFKRFSISVAHIEEPTDEEKMKVFLMLNTTGKVMDKYHLDKVRKMLEKK